MTVFINTYVENSRGLCGARRVKHALLKSIKMGQTIWWEGADAGTQSVSTTLLHLMSLCSIFLLCTN